MNFITTTIYGQKPFEIPRADQYLESLWDRYQVNLSKIGREISNLDRGVSALANKVRTTAQLQLIQVNQVGNLLPQQADGGDSFAIVLSNQNSRAPKLFQKNKTQLKVIACLLGIFLVIAMALLMADSRQLRVKVDGLINE